jgi:alpha-glucosidase
VVSRWGGADQQDDWAKLFLALLMGLRGNVFLYQGEELGLTQAAVPFERLRDPEAIANWPGNQGRDGARTPIPWTPEMPYGGFSETEPWLPMPVEHVKRAVAVQEKDRASVLACTRELVRLRRAHSAIRSGRFVALGLPAPLLGFERIDGSGRIRCLFNLGKAVRRCRMVQEGEKLFACGEIDQAKGMLGGLAACWLKL